MARLRYNGLTATLGADLLTADTTITFSGALTSAAGAVPTISGGDYIPLVIEGATSVEIVHLTAYTSGATTGAVTRAQESTTATDHASGTTIVNGLTVADMDELAAGAGSTGGVGDGDVGIEYGTITVTDFAARDDAVIQLDLDAVSHVSSDQATHPSVLHFPGGWNGYRYWMGFTPYVGGSDATEDPCVAVSNDRVNWSTPQGAANPLDDAPGGAQYNSDTELAISPDGTTLYLFWRQRNDAATGAEEIVYVRSTTDGVTWTAKQSVLTANKTAEQLASPAVLHDGTQWVMWTVDSVASPNVIKRRTASSVTGPWSAPTTCTVTGLPAGRDLWHLSVLKLGTQYVALLNDCNSGANGVGGKLYLMASTDQLAWTLNPTPITSQTFASKYDNLYRGTLVPTFENGRLEFDIWHGAWLASPHTEGIYYRRLAPASTSLTVQDENGTVATGVTQIDFQGAVVSAAAGSGEVVVTVTGDGTGSGGGGVAASQVQAYRSAALSVPSSSLTVIPFDAEDFDADGFHSTSTNPERFTVPTGLGGTYRIAAQVSTESAGGGSGKEYSLALYKNGASFAWSSFPMVSNQPTSIQIEALMSLADGEYVDLRMYQNSGAGVDLYTTANRRYCRLSMERVA